MSGDNRAGHNKTPSLEPVHPKTDSFSNTKDVHAGTTASTTLVNQYRNLPLRFETNRGQTDPQVKFLARYGTQTLFFTPTETLVRDDPALDSPGKATYLRMAWTGANAQTGVLGIDELPGHVNYLTGQDRGLWHTDVPTYAKIRYAGIYPGVDLLYYGDGGRLEYDLILAPGAKPEKIRFKLSGADRTHLDRNGDLLVHLGNTDLRFHQPVAYQVVSSNGTEQNTRTEVQAQYVLTSHGEVSFKVGPYDRSRPLIIDPQLTYSSYVGGSSSDTGWKVAVDSSGDAYLVGLSQSPDFPLASPMQSTKAATTSAVIVKLNPKLPGAASLLYSTYFGGSGDTIGRGIAIDSAGQIFIGGDTKAPDLPVTPGAYRTTCVLSGTSCSSDLFAAKLNPTGSSVLYSTYLGGTGNEFGFGLAIDTSDYIYLTGPTGSSDFPTTAGAYQRTFAGGGAPFGDAFVAVLNPAGGGATDLVYSTYLGGTGSEQSWAIAVDQARTIFIAGGTTSTDFPTSSNAFSTVYSGAGANNFGDAFVARLRPAGQGPADLLYSTYLGGSSDDRAEAIAVDATQTVYVTGFTMSANFPVTPATAYQSALGGGTCNGSPCADVFIARLDPLSAGANSLRYASFFGGSGFDLGHAIAVDSAGFVYVAGETDSLNLPLRNAIQNTCFGGCTPSPITDLLLAKFDLTQSGDAGLLFSSYLGGNDVDTAWGLTTDGSGNMYVTGQVFSTNFPTLMPFQSSCNNCVPFSSPTRSGDVFFLRVCTTGCPAVNLSAGTLSFPAQSVGSTSTAQSVTLLNSGGGDMTIVSIAVTGGNASDFSPANNCPVVLSPNNSCTINVTFTPTAGGTRTAAVTITDNGSGSPQTVTLSGTGVAPLVPDFTLGATPSSQTLQQGGNSTSYNLTITPSGGFTSPVNLSVSGLPAGATGTFSPNPATTNSTLTITTSASTPAGSSTLTITGVGGGLTRSTTVSLTVNPAGVLFDNAVSSGFKWGVTQATTPSFLIGSAPNRAAMIMVTMSTNNATNITASLGGVNATLVPGTDSGTAMSMRTLIFQVINPPSGMQMATVSWTPSMNVDVGVITVGNADQTTPVTNGTFVAASSSPSPATSLSITSNPGDLTASVAATTGVWASPYTNQLKKWGVDSGATGGDIGPGTGTTTHTWTDTWAGTGRTISGANFKTGVTGPDFTLSSSPSSQTVTQGGSATYNLTITPTGGFSGQVNLSVGGLPSGATSSFSANPAAGSSTLTVTTSAATAGGSYTLTLTGTSGALMHTGTVSLVVNAQSFALSSAPSSQTLQQGGGSTTYNVTITPSGGFTSPVNLSVSGLPTGATGTFSPNPATTTATLTITTSASTPVGSSTLTITGVGGGLTRSTTVSVTVSTAGVLFDNAVSSGFRWGVTSATTPSFLIGSSANRAAMIMVAMSANNATNIAANLGGVNATLVPGTDSGTAMSMRTLIFQVINPPSGMQTATVSWTGSMNADVGVITVGNADQTTPVTNGTFVATSPSPSPATSLTITSNPGDLTASTAATTGVWASPYTNQLKKWGIDSGEVGGDIGPGTGTTTHTWSDTWAATGRTISGANFKTAVDFTVSSSPSSQTVMQGGPATYSLTITPKGGFSGPVNLSVGGLPSGATGTFTPNPATTNSTLTITPSASTPGGSSTLTITGVGGVLTRSTTVSLTVNPAVFYDNAVSSGFKWGVTQATTPAFLVSSAANRAAMIMVTMSANNATNITASLGGVNATLVPGTDSGTAMSMRTLIFQVINPPSGMQTATVSWTGSMNADVGVVTASNADQSSPVTNGTFVAGSPSPSAATSLTITSNPGDLTASVAATTGVWASPYTNQLKKWGIDSGEVGGDIGPGTGTSTHTWSDTWAGTGRTISGANFKTLAAAPDFTLSSLPSTQTLQQGGSTTYNLTITPAGGFNSPVNLSVSGLPSGATGAFSPNPATTTSTLTITTSASTPVGSSTLTITGVGGVLTRSTTVSLTVNPVGVLFDNAVSSGFKWGVTQATTPSFLIGSGASRAAMIMVTMSANNATNITANLGGVNATLVAGTDSGTAMSMRTMIFQVINPPSGMQTATVSWTGSMNVDVGVIAVSGADQTTPVTNGTFVAASPSPSPATSLSITSNPGDLTASVAATTGVWASPYTNQLKKWGIDSSSAGGDIGPGTGTTTHTWTDTWAGTGRTVSGANFKAHP
jgi:hypothetical protein